MKILIYCLMAIAAGLIIYNFTFLDFEHISDGQSGTAMIGILCSGIVIMLMLILLVSKKIAEKAKQ